MPEPNPQIADWYLQKTQMGESSLDEGFLTRHQKGAEWKKNWLEKRIKKNEERSDY